MRFGALFLSLITLLISVQGGFNPLSADQAKQFIKEGKFDWIVDVRTPEEWNAGHYPSAFHIPLVELETQLPIQIKSLSDFILFYCKSGKRAANASIIAHDLGYKNPYYLENATYTDLMDDVIVIKL
jgi:phage shock protein E